MDKKALDEIISEGYWFIVHKTAGLTSVEISYIISKIIAKTSEWNNRVINCELENEVGKE